MRDLYKLTRAEASEDAIEEIMEQCGVNKTLATQLFKNAVMYNCVIEEIVGQAKFLMDMEDSE